MDNYKKYKMYKKQYKNLIKGGAGQQMSASSVKSEPTSDLLLEEWNGIGPQYGFFIEDLKKNVINV
jgi:hypothetical protein